MADVKPLHLILCWHMHQPDYRNPETGVFTLPWTYLHATKDYADMAWHLEHTTARAVVNFVPILLDQIEDYAHRFATGTVNDPLLTLLVKEDLDTLTLAERRTVFESCFRSDHAKMIEPYPAYKRLYDLHHLLKEEGDATLSYLSGQYLADLLVWYHLVWIGETVRRENELPARLMSKGRGFTRDERVELFSLVGEIVQGILPRYRRLAETGRVELSATPHHHPLAPLLIDFASAREAEPDAVLPHAPVYPGGRSRVAAHIETAVAAHRRRFGAAPTGMWPAEGALSQEALRLFAEHGCRWVASGEGVLANSLSPAERAGGRAEWLYRPYTVKGAPGVTCYFRDERLSDMIGFEYAKWYGSDAVSHFIASLEAIRQATPADQEPVVSVILDGENAWEYYPYNGYYFLSGLYQALEHHPYIHTTTFRDHLAECVDARRTGCPTVGKLSRVTAGSWVYGNLATWIGEPAKNRAWDLLCAAKNAFDLVMAGDRLSRTERAAAERHLFDCESSDWFWWFGDSNPGESVASFDRLFRTNLAILYRMLKLPVPAVLDEPLCHGGTGPVEAGGAMRRGGA